MYLYYLTPGLLVNSTNLTLKVYLKFITIRRDQLANMLVAKFT